MSILNKPYELSIWQDVQLEDNSHTISMKEEKIAVIGSNKMKNQNKAINPKLTRNINGNIKFTFNMFVKYIDNISGEETKNPFVDLLKNETKLKLYYEDNWFDLIIKKIEENLADNQNSYEAISQHINELSKNGFNVILDSSLYNNTDDILTLAQTVLADTDWQIDTDSSDFVIQTQEEALIPLKLKKSVKAYQIDDSEIVDNKPLTWKKTSNFGPSVTIGQNSLILAFYSSCAAKPSLFQFYYFGANKSYNDIKALVQLDDDRVITTKGKQYCIIIDNADSEYTNEKTEFGFTIPSFVEYASQEVNNVHEYILTEMRGNRYVCGEISEYNPILNKMLYQCIAKQDKLNGIYQKFENLPKYWYTQETSYISPIVIENLGGNNDFSETTGWKAGVVYKPLSRANIASNDMNEVKNHIGTCESFNELDKLINDNLSSLSYVPSLSYKNAIIKDKNGNIVSAKKHNTTSYNNIARQCLISSGPYHNRYKIGSMKQGEKYNAIFKIKKDSAYGLEEAVWKDLNRPEMPGMKIEIAYHPYDAENKCYRRLLTYANALTIQPYGGQFGAEILYCNQGISSNTSGLISVINDFITRIESTEGVSLKNLAAAIGNMLYNAEREQWLYEQWLKTHTNTTVYSFFDSFIYENYLKPFRDVAYVVSEADDSDSKKTYLINFLNGFIKFLTEAGTDHLTIWGMGDQSDGSIVLTTQVVTSINPILSFEERELTAKNWFADEYFKTGVPTSWQEYWGAPLDGASNSDFLTKFNFPDFGLADNTKNGRYAAAQLEITRTVTEKEFQSKNFQIFIYLNEDVISNVRNKPDTLHALDIIDFQLVKHAEGVVETDSGPKLQYVTPLSQNIEVVKNTIYTYYTDNDITLLNNGTLTEDELPEVHSSTNHPYKANMSDSYFYEPCYYESGKKIRSVTVKESNYFNIISTLSETFEQWPEFVITRNSNNPGEITNKQIRFKNYVGIDNPAVFRPETNLKSIKRNINSSNIVTKMIVKPNMNALAPNGICTIAGSNANETGETALYDFSYYINHNLIDRNKLSNLLYTIGHTTKVGGKIQFLDMFGEDVKKFYPDAYYNLEDEGKWTCQNYYNRLKALNYKLQEIDEQWAEVTIERSQVYTDWKTASNLVTDAQNECESLSVEIDALMLNASMPDFPYDNPSSLTPQQRETIKKSSGLERRVAQWYKNKSVIEQNSGKLISLQNRLDRLDGYINSLEKNQTEYIGYKQELNKAFFLLYGRFIQEGTWIDQQYIDPEKYHADALSVLYTSAQPQIQYTFDVNEISSVPGYEFNNFNIGDKTYVEDTEFFGYNAEGYPYREEVILTEKTENLDNSSQNSLKVQNYKTQFQDLFQRITAQVQQTKFTEGAYQRAVERTSADSDESIQFLESILNESNMEIKRRGSQTITWGEDGIILEDAISPSKKLRLIGGQILYNVTNSHGLSFWKTLLSTDGMSASTLNTGVLNTSKIEIRNENTPTFTWDSQGLTAYAWTKEGSILKTNFGQGVRYDKYGIYGYNLGEGRELEDFKPFSGTNEPSNLDEASQELIQNEKVGFYLGWSGLKIKQQANNTAYDVFVGNGVAAKMDNPAFIRVDKTVGNDTSTIFAVTPTGAELTGKITANDGKIGAWNLSVKGLYSGEEQTADVYLYAEPKEVKVNGISKNILMQVGNNFYVENDGSFITHKGNIGSWILQSDYLYSVSKDFYLNGGCGDIRSDEIWLSSAYRSLNTKEYYKTNLPSIAFPRFIVPSLQTRNETFGIKSNYWQSETTSKITYSGVNRDQTISFQAQGEYDLEKQPSTDNIMSCVCQGRLIASPKRDDIPSEPTGYILGVMPIEIARKKWGNEHGYRFLIKEDKQGAITISKTDFYNSTYLHNTWSYHVPVDKSLEACTSLFLSYDTTSYTITESDLLKYHELDEQMWRVTQEEDLIVVTPDRTSLRQYLDNHLRQDDSLRIALAQEIPLTTDEEEIYVKFLIGVKIPIQLSNYAADVIGIISQFPNAEQPGVWKGGGAIYQRPNYKKGSITKNQLKFDKQGSSNCGLLYNRGEKPSCMENCYPEIADLTQYNYTFSPKQMTLIYATGVQDTPKTAVLSDGSMYVNFVKVSNALLLDESLEGIGFIGSKYDEVQYCPSKTLTFKDYNGNSHTFTIKHGLIVGIT